MRSIGTAALLALLTAGSSLASSVAFAQASPSPFTAATRYDAMRRVTGTIAPDPDGTGPLHYLATRNTYDAAGRLVRVERGELANWKSESIDPIAWGTDFNVFSQVDTSYDGLSRKTVERISAAGVTYAVTQYSYDAIGRLECTAVRMNPATFGTLPASACTQGTAGSDGPDRITRNIYDDTGQLLQSRKAVGTSLEQAYATYSYTPNGKQEYVVDANGNKARLTYDGLDRQLQWQFPSTTAPSAFNPSTPANALATAGTVNTNDYEAYGYDANDNRTSLRKRDGRTFTSNYDALNRVTSKIVPDACVGGYACTSVNPSSTRDVYYSYDLRGLQTAARFDSTSGTDAVTSAYDGFGRQTSSSTSMAGTAQTLSYLYDADGNRTQVTHPDSNYFTYVYDGLDRPIDVLQSGLYQRLHFDWDNQGRRSGEWRGAVYSSYGYDAISRFAGFTHDLAGSAADLTTTLGYNPASQITSRTRSNTLYAFPAYVNASRSYVPNGLNQYASVAGSAFGYDANGNLTSDGVRNYAYDAENRLVATSSGTSMVYDPLGRLYQVLYAGGADTRFLYDGDQLTVEYDGSGNLLRRHVHGTGEDDPMLWYEGADLSVLRSLQADQQGSVVSVADSAGNTLAVYAYDEYGIPGSTGYTSRFQYTGQAWIPEAGMYYYKARMYSPTLGRFMQTDPIGYQDQNNLYAYTGNDPINGRDPSGTFGLFGNCPAGSVCTSTDPNASNAIPTTRGERKALAGGTEAGVDSYWGSRCSRGDPVGCLAGNFNSSKTATDWGAKISRRGLEDAIRANHIVGWKYVSNSGESKFEPIYDESAAKKDYVNIRINLAKANMAAVDRDNSGVRGLLSTRQIAEYHWQVFEKYHVSWYVYGGSRLGSSDFGLNLMGRTFCGFGSRGCDSR